MTWTRRLTRDYIAPWLGKALTHGLLDEASPSLIFHDLTEQTSKPVATVRR